jgi:hypothetical protein
MADSTMVAALSSAYRKRLQKAGVDPSDTSDSFSMPAVTIDKKGIPFSTKDDTIDVSFVCADPKVPLLRVDIAVNNVPLDGADGRCVGKRTSSRFEQSVRIPLSEGKNEIKVSAMNVNGTRSNYQTLNIVRTVTSRARPHLYLVSIGVSKFADRKYNLSYAAKDAADIARAFEGNSSFSGVTPIVLTDSSATKDRIRSCRAALASSSVDDVIIVFAATHGVFDDSLNYYLATADMDFSHPSERGLAYDELEELFAGAPARHRLLLIDACNSGEIDKDEIGLGAEVAQQQLGVISRGFKTVTWTGKTPMGMQSSFELMKELFTDLENGTGIVSIASAGGREYAFESAEWHNGVFTYALLNGLKSGQADFNNDGSITVAELREYATQRVRFLTGGKQTPTSRRENPDNDFVISSSGRITR